MARIALVVWFTASLAIASRSEAARLTGAITYEDFTIGLSGFTGRIALPARGIAVEIVDSEGKAVAQTTCDASGTFDIDATAIAVGGFAAVRLKATNAAVRVTDPAGNDYAWTGTPQVVTSDPFAFATIHVTAADDAGALNIADVLFAAHRFAATTSDVAIPGVTAVWKRSYSSLCFSCYDGNGTVFVGNTGAGRNDDTDEYDDTLLLHEYAHHLQKSLTCDTSPGGAHLGCTHLFSDALAWTEGVANFFAVFIANRDDHIDHVSSHYLDTIGNLDAGSSTFGTDLEANDACAAGSFGTDNEDSVAKILWDLEDDAADGPDDYHLPGGTVWQLILQMRGSDRCDIAAFAERLCAARLNESPQYRPIFLRFNVVLPANCDPPPPPRRRAVRH